MNGDYMNKVNLAALRYYRRFKRLEIESILPELNKYVSAVKGREVSIPKNSIQKYESGAIQLQNINIIEFFCNFYGVSPNCFINTKNKYNYEFLIPELTTCLLVDNKYKFIDATFKENSTVLSSPIGIISNLVEMKISGKKKYVLLSENAMDKLPRGSAGKSFIESIGKTPGGCFDEQDASKQIKIFGRVKDNYYSFYSGERKKDDDEFWGVMIDNNDLKNVETLYNKWVSYIGEEK